MPKKITTHSQKKIWSHIILSIILFICAIGSITGLYFLYQYWYPPVLRFQNSDFAKTVVLETTKGNITIAIDTEAQFAAAQFTRLIRTGFYTGTRFHRVVPNLLIEGGDPLTRNIGEKNFWGQGGLSNAFKNEIHANDVMTSGTVAFSSSGTGTYGSQFFILTKDTPWLKGKHTIIGRVTNGMDVVHEIEHLPLTVTGLPLDDVVINSIISL